MGVRSALGTAVLVGGLLMTTGCVLSREGGLIAGPQQFHSSCNLTLMEVRAYYDAGNQPANERYALEYQFGAYCDDVDDTGMLTGPTADDSADISVDAHWYPFYKDADEKITVSDQGALVLRSVTTFHCDKNPWDGLDETATCTVVDEKIDVQPGQPGLAAESTSQGIPLSAAVLNRGERFNLDMMALNSESELPQPTPTPKPVINPGSLGNIPSILQSCPATKEVVGVTAPNIGQIYSGSVPLNVRLAVGDCNGLTPLYDLQWQVRLPGQSVWSSATVLAQLDGKQNPNGVTLPAGQFAPYKQFGTTTDMRVRARLHSDPNAPWSDWRSFLVT